MFVEENLFGIRSALTTADILMTALSLRQPGDPVFEAACLYQFQSPCTHRNFKSLVYGDMNCLDWTSQTDLALNRRGEQWYPTDNELQLRHPTPAYFIFRMLARCVAGAEKNKGNPVLRQGHCAFWGNRQNVYSTLKEVVVKTPDALLINILNPTDDKAEKLEFDISEFAGQYRFAVVRECSRQSRDQVKSVFPIDGSAIRLDAEPMSLIQIMLTPLALDCVESVRLEEITATPGCATNLNLFQTTRFKMMAKINGQEYDLSDLNTTWASSEPNYVDVLGAGLVIRLRNSDDPIEISAELDGTKHSALRQIQGPLKSGKIGREEDD